MYILHINLKEEQGHIFSHKIIPNLPPPFLFFKIPFLTTPGVEGFKMENRYIPEKSPSTKYFISREKYFIMHIGKNNKY